MSFAEVIIQYFNQNRRMLCPEQRFAWGGATPTKMSQKVVKFTYTVHIKHKKYVFEGHDLRQLT